MVYQFTPILTFPRKGDLPQNCHSEPAAAAKNLVGLLARNVVTPHCRPRSFASLRMTRL